MHKETEANQNSGNVVAELKQSKLLKLNSDSLYELHLLSA